MFSFIVFYNEIDKLKTTWGFNDFIILVHLVAFVVP